MLRPFLRLTSLALLICGGWSACTLDEPARAPDHASLSLNFTQEESLTHLTWDKVNVTGFKEYILLQSTSPIPDSPEPEVNQQVSVLKRINDLDITTFSVTPSLLAPQLCYKLYCAVDDRFLYSDNICIDQSYILIGGFYDRACHAYGVDDLVMFNRVDNLLTACNYTTGAITNSVSDIVLNFPSLQMVSNGINTNVYGVNQSPGWLRRYTYPELNATHSKSYNDILWAAYTHENFVFVGTSEFNKNFQILNASNLSVETTRPGVSSSQNIAAFGQEPITILTLGNAESKKYTISNTGEILSQQYINARLNSPDVQHNCGQGEEVFICGAFGEIFKVDGSKIGQLNLDFNSAVSLTRISPADEYAAVIINENGILRCKIFDIRELPTISIAQTFEVPQASYGDIIFEPDAILLTGTSFISSQQQTFILSFPFEP